MKQLRTSAFIAIGVTACLGLQSCVEPPQVTTQSTNGLQGRLVITGSSTVAPLVGEIGKRFESEHPSVRIDVQTGGSSRGIADVRTGVADIGMVSRAIKEEEDLYAFAIARDGIGIIVHEDNSVNSLSDQQVTDIYTGKIDNWQEINGKNAPITVVNKAEGRSTLEVFLDYLQIQNSEIKASVVIGDNQQGIQTVAGNPDSIGYVSIGTAEFSRNSGISIKLLPLNNIAATTENVQNETFPLSRPLNLVTKAQPQELTQAFIEFTQSEEVHDIVQKQEFVPIAD